MTLRSLARSTLLLAIPSLSHALTLDCQLTPNAIARGAITERYVIQHDEGSAQAIVSDGVILYYNDSQPMTAKVSEDSGKKLVVTWNVQITNKTGQMTKMQYRASWFKADGNVIIRAVPGGYSNDFEARGTCKKV
jgi:hypothetical protein